MTEEQLRDTLESIDHSIRELSRRESKSNGWQTILWVIQIVVLPLLAWNSVNVAEIMGNRYTTHDFSRHQTHHNTIERELTQISTKLEGLPPVQIEKNRAAIENLTSILWTLQSDIERLKEAP